MSIMPLNDRDTVRGELEDSVFADRDLTRPVAKYRFPAEGTLPRDAFQLAADELMLDGNARQNLATFCQTWEEPEVLGLMALSINKNMIDRDEYPQSAEIGLGLRTATRGIGRADPARIPPFVGWKGVP
jgi:glutamate decarboxylase